MKDTFNHYFAPYVEVIFSIILKARLVPFLLCRENLPNAEPWWNHISHVYQHHNKVHSWSNITSSQQNVPYHLVKQQSAWFSNRTSRPWRYPEVMECHKRTSSSCAGGGWLLGATADDRCAAQALRRLVVIPCAEHGQVSIVGRTNNRGRANASFVFAFTGKIPHQS